jgi:small subunit ribosomal protein S9
MELKIYNFMETKNKIILSKDTLGIGRRKQSTARVSLIPGNGNVIINNTLGEQYLQFNNSYLNKIWAPLRVLGLENQFDIIALVNGGGLTGQAFSIQLGVSRLLCKMNTQNRGTLKSYGFLTRDARIKERKKYGLKKARKASQYSKR